jgi:hypothetical protein
MQIGFIMKQRNNKQIFGDHITIKICTSSFYIKEVFHIAKYHIIDIHNTYFNQTGNNR